MPINRRKRNTVKRSQAKPLKRKKVRTSFAISPKLRRWIGAFAGLLIIVGAALWLKSWMSNPLNWQIKRVEIKGDLKYLQKTEINTAIGNHVRTNLYLLDDKTLEQELEKVPWVRDVSLRKSWPDELIIKVKERHPVAYWGEEQLLDNYGVIFNAQLPERRSDFPLLYSPEEIGQEMGERYLKVLKWLKDVPLKVVSLKEDARGSWVIGFDNGLLVNVGVHEQEKRLKRFVVGYREVLNKKLGQISSVDLRYTNGFTVAWK